MSPSDEQVGELDRRLTRLEPLVRRRGGSSYPSGGDPGEVLTFVGPNPNDVAWVTPAAGGGGDLNYIHTQSVFAATWTVSHGLGKFPAVEVVDSGGNVLIPDVHYVDTTTLILTFGVATLGKAYIN